MFSVQNNFHSVCDRFKCQTSPFLSVLLSVKRWSYKFLTHKNVLLDLLYYSSNVVNGLSKQYVGLYIYLPTYLSIHTSVHSSIYQYTTIIIIITARVLCPRTDLSLQTQTPRLQFCTNVGLPFQTQESRLQFY